jgi:ectoine hydroxylase-related dioxygenase (phytanoyl-CoA dioxygenase family)
MRVLAVSSADRVCRQIAREGFAILSGVYSAEEVRSIIAELSRVLDASHNKLGSIRNSEGVTYAARNVMTIWPPVITMWRRPVLLGILQAILGTQYGLVRVLYFDKPPEQSWCLPWHKDMTIAVRENQRPSSQFTKPTRKAGIPHVEAPQEVLEGMLTARIHLDDVTQENGPLRVAPGSHVLGKTLRIDEADASSVLVAGGDVLLMRPLLAHCSPHSDPGTARHRRTLHLEFAASKDLPEGYAWHDFISV